MTFLLHYRYRKVTPDIHKQMIKIRAEHETYQTIADFFKVCYATVAYHLDKEQRMKAIDRARKSIEKNGEKPKTEAKKKYNAEYYKDRYHNDPEFRRKVIRANSGFKFKGD